VKGRATKKRNLLILVFGLIGALLVGVGVFASTLITINSGQTINLGAGSAGVNVCGSAATISTTQYFNTNTQSYYTGTIGISGINTGDQCAGKTLSISFLQGGQVYSATWPITAGYTNYYFGQINSSSNSTPNAYANATMSAFDTAASNISTIAVAVQ
jgi:hypothetical protein